MILLSTTLPARANRLTNLVIATLLVPWMAFNLAGGEWLAYYGLGFAVELGALVFILRTAWTWPRTHADAAVVATADRLHQQAQA